MIEWLNCNPRRVYYGNIVGLGSSLLALGYHRAIALAQANFVVNWDYSGSTTPGATSTPGANDARYEFTGDWIPIAEYANRPVHLQNGDLGLGNGHSGFMASGAAVQGARLETFAVAGSELVGVTGGINVRGRDAAGNTELLEAVTLDHLGNHRYLDIWVPGGLLPYDAETRFELADLRVEADFTVTYTGAPPAAADRDTRIILANAPTGGPRLIQF